MSYVENNLMKGEEVVHSTKQHWIIFFWPMVLVVLGVFFVVAGESSDGIRGFGAILFLVGLVMIIPAIVSYMTNEFAVTNKRVIIKVGLIKRITLEMNLEKIESIGVDQSIPGRIFNYGTIIVTGTGATKEPFKAIAEPMEFRKAVQS
jgi:uncharacterized membrane protein YdbT with pleckstrin-like domain